VNKFNIIANWKMNLSYHATEQFFAQHSKELAQLAKDVTLIICPSTDALSLAHQQLKNMKIALGAQGCSAYQKGAYTGQVMAASLRELGCTHCIIGHSEQRAYLQETNETVAQKAALLISYGIIPIICVGESQEEHEQGKTNQSIQDQLTPLVTSQTTVKTELPLFIAYEPTWAIGSGKTAEIGHITTTFTAIDSFIKQQLPNRALIFLYGGGVTPENAVKLRSLPLVDGLLIGTISTDFQMLQKIVLSVL
jgi:triosephosphate isomerase